LDGPQLLQQLKLPLDADVSCMWMGCACCYPMDRLCCWVASASHVGCFLRLLWAAADGWSNYCWAARMLAALAAFMLSWTVAVASNALLFLNS
ncbi:hypothetical protein Dimus_030366, partial [Dionaea muscipula]